LNYKEPKI